MSDTHINAFITDVENAYEEAVKHLGAFKDAVDKLRKKYEAQDETSMVSETPVAEVPAVAPSLEVPVQSIASKPIG